MMLRKRMRLAYIEGFTDARLSDGRPPNPSRGDHPDDTFIKFAYRCGYEDGYRRVYRPDPMTAGTAQVMQVCSNDE